MRCTRRCLHELSKILLALIALLALSLENQAVINLCY